MTQKKKAPTVGAVEGPKNGHADAGRQRCTTAKNGQAETWGGARRGGERVERSLPLRPPPETAVKFDFGSLVYAPYGHNPLHDWAGGRRKNGLNPAVSPPKLTVYPHGFALSRERFVDGKRPDHLRDTVRGEIRGFSNKAAVRLRETMLTLWRPHSDPYAVTLTTRGVYTPEQWRSMVKRFRTALRRQLPEWGAVWRVELQRRKTPHLHCLFWVPDQFPTPLVYDRLQGLWLSACREQDDPHSRRHALRLRFLTGPEWLRYCACHDSKHKAEQLGWVGKQWGVWNVDALERREPLTWGVFPFAKQVVFLRRLRHFSRRRYHRKDQRLAPPLRYHAGRNLPAYVLSAPITAQLLRGLVDERADE